MSLDAARCDPNDGNFDGRPGAVLLTELGIERVCTRCGEAWPYDAEFFHRHPKGFLGLGPMCRACRAEGSGRAGSRLTDDWFIRMLAAVGVGIEEIARRAGCAPTTVQRVLRS